MAGLEDLLFSATPVDAAWLKEFERSLPPANGTKQCEEMIERCYAMQPEARDGFSRLAYGLVHLGRKQEALSFFARDWALDRMRRWQFLRYVETLLDLGERAQAESRIDDFYRRHPEARDGWATIAFHATGAGDDRERCALLRKDCAQLRLSPALVVKLAGLLVRLGEAEAAGGRISAAIQLVVEAYALDPTLRDGYSRCARFALERREWAAACELLRKDHASGRISPDWLLCLAEAEAMLGNGLNAERLVAEAYQRDAGAHSGYARCAQPHLDRQDWKAAHRLLQRDHGAGRISARWTLRLAEVEAALGNLCDAETLVVEAYRQDANLRDGFVGVAGRLARDAPDARLGLFRREASCERLTRRNAWTYAAILVDTFAGSANDRSLFDEALRQIERVFREEGERLSPEFGDFADRLWKAGFVDEAIALLRQADRMGRLTAPERLQLAGFLCRRGELAEGGKQADEAMRADSSLKSAWRARQAALRTVAVPDINRLIAAMLGGCPAPREMWVAYMRANAGRICRDVEVLGRYVQPGDHVVDIGCSPPLLLALLHERGFRKLSAVDPFLSGLEPFFARTGIEAFPANLTNLPVERLRESADMICLCEVIEHVAVNLVAVLHDLHGMLRPGGRLYLTTPNLRSISGLFSLLVRRSGLASKPFETVREQLDRPSAGWGYFGHLREYTVREVVLLVESCGFRHVASHMDPVSVLPIRVPPLVKFLERTLPSWRLFGAHVFVKT